MIQRIFVILLLLVAHSTLSQRINNLRSDSLIGKSFEYLKNRYESNVQLPNKAKIYATAWLQKAKSEKNNYFQLASAYKATAIFSNKAEQLNYADSMVVNAIKTGDKELIGTSYLAKGILNYRHNKHDNALNAYIMADEYISKKNNPHLNFQIKYGIAQIKYYLGFYNEAISLYRECIEHFKDENDRAYLNSLHGLALCHTKIGKYELASEGNNLGVESGRLFDDTGMEFYFIHSEGINQCLKGNYTAAIKMLNTALPNIIRSKDHANESVAYFYIGKSNWELKQYDTAIIYFKKIDGLFQKENYILPDCRKGYEYLIDYYKQKKDTDSQLLYINQLLKVDNILAQDYKYLLKKIVKEYDTKALLSAKNEIEHAMLLTRITACLVLSIMGVIIIHLIRKNKKNQKLFEELMNRNTSLPKNSNETTEIVIATSTESDKITTTQEINPELEAAIVKRLEKFELTKKYLEKDMNLSKMATILYTNSKYVTKVIAKHRGKGTIEYITELKLDYIVEMLKTESKYRNYTNNALAEEAGFRTTQNFTRAFKKYTGITPTYFSYKLKKSTTTDNPQ